MHDKNEVLPVLHQYIAAALDLNFESDSVLDKDYCMRGVLILRDDNASNNKHAQRASDKVLKKLCLPYLSY